MMITSTESKCWYQNDEVDPSLEPVSISLGKECQKIRGFGGCFSELGAAALQTLPKEIQNAVNEELFKHKSVDRETVRNISFSNYFHTL